MKKFYSFIIMALVATAANAQAPVSINELRGTWVFRGVASDWDEFGEELPTVHTFKLAVNEETNEVTATTTIGDVYAYGAAADGSEDYVDVLHGKYDPETQILNFGDSYDEAAGIYSYFVDEYYNFYSYSLAFKVSRDEQGKVVFQMTTPEGSENMFILEFNDYDSSLEDPWVFYYYGYDAGATMTAPINSPLAAGAYEIAYTNGEGEQVTIPCDIKEDIDGLTMTFNGVDIPMIAKSEGFGANKVTYAYAIEDHWTYYGEGDEDYVWDFASYYYGKSTTTFYANGDDTYSGDVSIYCETVDDDPFVMHQPVLRKRGATGIKNVENNVKATATQYFDLSGRRISKPAGLYIEKANGKVIKRLAK